MTTPTLDAITRLLAGIDTAGSFATRFTVPVDDLHLEVEGVGRIRMPVSAAVARKLCATARPARYGLKDQTLLDRSVRDTWEIPKSRISIDLRQWKTTLGPALERIRRDLGLPQACRLEAKLHNLLVYTPGQFFATHQDSEKADGMIGTLVVSLPSPFTGGSFVIEHHDEKRRFRASGDQLTMIAFYTDCRHEVRPIEQGHRVVLTYNLIADGGAAASDSAADRIGALSGLVRRFFETPMAPRWAGDRQREAPDRLIYLLDHEYTQHGLGWKQLKNADALRAGALLDVARQLDCEAWLALADVHETWACEDDYSGYGAYRSRRGYRGRGWDDDDYGDEEGEGEYGDDNDDDGDDDRDATVGGRSDVSRYELTELIDSEIELRHWIGPEGQTQEMSSPRVDNGELCYTKPSVECEPFESEHEGYTGNAGNTVDHWYHRAAVVLWPRERDFVIRAKASARWAVDEIGKMLRAGKGAQALEQARRVLPFWPEAVARAPRSALLAGTLRLAIGLDDAEVAAALLAPFRLIDVAPEAARHVAGLVERYGADWGRGVLRQWVSKGTQYEPSDKKLEWMALALPALSQALSAASVLEAPALVRWLLDDRWDWMREQVKALQQGFNPVKIPVEAARLGKPMLALIESCAIANETGLRDQVIAFLIGDPDELPIQLPLELLRAADDEGGKTWRQLGLEPLRVHLIQQLTHRLAAPARGRDDWSIRTPVRCTCGLCATLSRFLVASNESRFEWPLATDKRNHVHGIIDSRGLPVRHQTRRTGRPFTLVLEKTRAVFERDAAERQDWAIELEWLESRDR